MRNVYNDTPAYEQTSPSRAGGVTLALLLVLIAGAVWAAKKPPMGKPAPEISLPGIGSDGVVLSKLRGKVVFVDFWASWCMPCRQLMPRIAEIKTRFPDIEVIAISVDVNPEKALTFLRQVEPSLKAVHDTAQLVSEAYGVARMPSSFVIDKQGDLRFRHDGYTEKDLASVEREIQLLLNE